uniref:Uncharacterized protein n=1 Tax=Panagrolaimus davidi TaxID=227884 RepID=A0A914QAR8_9BILA
MKKFWIFPLLIVFMLFNVGELIWVGEQFWTIIDSEGSFRDQRTITDFISFKAENDIDDRYIAYWITPHCDGENQFEAFGDAYFGDNGKLCAKFIDKNNHPIEVCGGFRILSINSQDHENPFEWRPICDVTNENIAVGLNQHIIRIWQNDRFQFSYGGVLLDRGRAYAVDVNGAVLHIFRSNDTNFYCSNIELLVVRDGYVAKEYVHDYDGTKQHRHRNYGHIFTPDEYANY